MDEIGYSTPIVPYLPPAATSLEKLERKIDLSPQNGLHINVPITGLEMTRMSCSTLFFFFFTDHEICN